MTTQENQQIHPSHHPFAIRKVLVLSGLAVGILSGFLFWNPLFGVVFYFCWVTLWDGIIRYVLGLKASSYVDPEELLKFERVTSEELDQYFDTRLYIRLVSLGIASIAFGISYFLFSYALEAFCVAYGFSTLLGILTVRLFVKDRRPRLIYRDPRFDHPPWPLPDTSAYMDYLRWSKGEIAPMRW